MLSQHHNSSFQIKLNTTKYCRFVTDLSNSFSKYYSRIHILEDEKFEHLHQTMHARLYLLKAIQSIFKIFLNLFNIEPLERI
jgi:arginyl-tRNA synthetase